MVALQVRLDWLDESRLPRRPQGIAALILEEKTMVRLTWVLAVVMLTAVGGCASFQRTRGVDNLWRDAAAPAPVIGTTTRSEILAALGPPSQVISLGDQTVFYYLKEFDQGKGGIFLVYNWLQEDVSYDRAIFFFDADGVLQDYALSHDTSAAHN